MERADACDAAALDASLAAMRALERCGFGEAQWANCGDAVARALWEWSATTTRVRQVRFFGFLVFLVFLVFCFFWFRSIGLLSFDLIFDRSRLSFSVRFHRFHRPRSKLTRRPPRSARPQLTMRQAELEMAMEDAEERAAVQRGRAKASGAPARGESSPPSVLTL
jgi:hypothetical protein